MRRCVKCGAVKPLEAFRLTGGGTSGRKQYRLHACLECIGQANRRRYHEGGGRERAAARYREKRDRTRGDVA